MSFDKSAAGFPRSSRTQTVLFLALFITIIIAGTYRFSWAIWVSFPGSLLTVAIAWGTGVAVITRYVPTRQMRRRLHIVWMLLSVGAIVMSIVLR